nr:polyprenol monophosphomannose synthase [Ardenticatena sp.]
MRTCIVVPTYNESDNIRALIEALFALPLDDMHLVIVDDHSPDGTADIARSLASQYDGRIHVIVRNGKQGLGSAYKMGFAYALSLGADTIVQMDADFSHSPDYIPQMVALLDTYDVVVGSRYVKGGRVDERWSWWRYFLSWWANQVYTRLILRLRVKDMTAGFKAFRRAVLEQIDFSRVVSNGYIFQVEVAYLCEKLGFRVHEIPIYFEDRRIGQSKLSIPVKIEAALRVWQIRWRHRHVRPAVSAARPTYPIPAPHQEP